SPHRNDLCVGPSLVLAAIAASLAFSVNALILLQNELAVQTTAQILNVAINCIGLAVICLLLAFVLAYIDRYHAWEFANEINQRTWAWGLIVPNVIGLMSFVLVFMYTKPR